MSGQALPGAASPRLRTETDVVGTDLNSVPSPRRHRASHSSRASGYSSSSSSARNSAQQQWTRNWVFETGNDGEVSIQCEGITFDLKVLYLIESGLQSATDIAKELRVNKSTICRAATRLEKLKFIEIKNRQYRSIRYGRP
jgi:hypothetical protein